MKEFPNRLSIPRIASLRSDARTLFAIKLQSLSNAYAIRLTYSNSNKLLYVDVHTGSIKCMY